MKFWWIIAILAFLVGIFLNTIKDMRRSTDAYAKQRAKELAEMQAHNKQQSEDKSNQHEE